jgi:ubiquinol-cytochrome c reductase cytochrome c1 subunit
MLRALSIAAAAAVAALGVAFAAGEAHHPRDYPFSFESPLGGYDMAAVQRGYQVYAEVCSSCHALEHLAYRHLGEEGGPFAAYRVRNHETGEEETVIGKPEHGGRFVDVTENPFVRAIAASATIADIDPSSGQPVDRPGRVSDRFRRPFPNDIAARASNGGAYPPDLSVITSARHGGADYIYSLLTGYTGETHGETAIQYVNPYFSGGLISMAPPLSEGRVTYADGTQPTLEQHASDVVTFLQWSADPHMVERKRVGLIALAFLLVLAGLLYLAYKQVWRGESH